MAPFYLIASSKVLQEGVKAGLTLYDISSLCYRDDFIDFETKVPSPLEVIVARSLELTVPLFKESEHSLASASRAIVDELPSSQTDTVDLKEFFGMSFLSVSSTQPSPYKDWAFDVVDRAFRKDFEPFDLDRLEGIDGDLVRQYYSLFMGFLVAEKISGLRATRE